MPQLDTIKEQQDDYRRKQAERDEEHSRAGRPGIGFDPSCGTLEPSISIGGGFGVGMDGHLTYGMPGFGG